MINLISQNLNILLIAKAAVIIILGILVGFIFKKIIFKIIDSFILKKIFKKDLNSYETSSLINRIFVEIICWAIIIIFVNYGLNILKINLLTNLFIIINREIPKFLIFVTIIVIGLVLSKLVSSYIKSKHIDKKEEISTVAEIVIIIAFVLSAIEYLGIRASAVLELYRAFLYLLIALIVLLAFKPEFLKKNN